MIFMAKVYSFEKLHAWQDAIKLTERIYEITKVFPDEEKFGLKSQIRRAVVSISLNIAEGKGRYSKKEFIHFLYLARGSLYEVITCLKLSEKIVNVQLKDTEMAFELIDSVSSKISGLINHLKS